MAAKEKSYRVVRQERGKPDVVTTFARIATFKHVVRWCEEEGYTVFGHRIIETPDDEDFLSSSYVRVGQQRLTPEIPTAL